MADIKISDLVSTSPATKANLTDQFETNQGGTSKGMTGTVFQSMPRLVNAQTGTTYTLVSADAGALVTLSNAAAITLTVPPNSSVPIDVNAQIDLGQLGAGQVTIAQGAGVTINSKGTNKKITGQYSGATLIKTATDVWWLVGDLAA